MRKIVFPSVDSATEDGLVAIGGDLAEDTLETAYRQGIFPWPVSVELPLAWFSPDPRGVLDFSELHVAKSFEKFIKKNQYRVSFNQAFRQVIFECARMPRKNQPETWITPAIIEGYCKFHDKGRAYSVEVWNTADELVAGMYGVVLGNFVSGESMFMKEDNTSKLALISLIMYLKDKGITWLDTQMVTPVVAQFGGKYVPRTEFLGRLMSVDWTAKDLF
jgi:leucyl/phenylalanyl-tRNA---protein transferase